MEEYKIRFIKFLLESGALQVGGETMLKNGRLSPWFVNVGNCSDGDASNELGRFYADAMTIRGCDPL